MGSGSSRALHPFLNLDPAVSINPTLLIVPLVPLWYLCRSFNKFQYRDHLCPSAFCTTEFLFFDERKRGGSGMATKGFAQLDNVGGGYYSDQSVE